MGRAKEQLDPWPVYTCCHKHTIELLSLTYMHILLKVIRHAADGHMSMVDMTKVQQTLYSLPL